ncbi:hypothetical protein HMPREF1162_0486 [ [[Propionibacterium] namnetense SK182B-JCVI]|uniref:Uncharacterized protein n=1 Tax=[Propionibacterium] namnetense SK182B-JCVI TaxID=1051006 RepID=F9NTW1_9ACTN|nr:hypothetical protein HMPREF1162_0486 [ [[Propionibacterium] namnetense SK182B-JCVI]
MAAVSEVRPGCEADHLSSHISPILNLVFAVRHCAVLDYG